MLSKAIVKQLNPLDSAGIPIFKPLESIEVDAECGVANKMTGCGGHRK